LADVLGCVVSTISHLRTEAKRECHTCPHKGGAGVSSASESTNPLFKRATAVPPFLPDREKDDQQLPPGIAA
jgi:hypothetical protein